MKRKELTSGQQWKKFLPVTLLEGDDREEHPEGISFQACPGAEGFLKDCSGQWGKLLGYNKLILKDSAKLILEYQGDPILAVGRIRERKSLRLGL